jgi:hypothetical protein
MLNWYDMYRWYTELIHDTYHDTYRIDIIDVFHIYMFTSLLIAAILSSSTQNCLENHMFCMKISHSGSEMIRYKYCFNRIRYTGSKTKCKKTVQRYIVSRYTPLDIIMQCFCWVSEYLRHCPEQWPFYQTFCVKISKCLMAWREPKHWVLR